MAAWSSLDLSAKLAEETIITPRMSLFFTDYSLAWLGLYDACGKYLFELNSGRSKLYDVCRDPDETNDLSDREPDRISAYRSRLEQWIAVQNN